MKNYFLGFLSAYFILTALIAVKNSVADSGQSQTAYGTPGQIGQDMENLFKDKQNKNKVMLFRSTPTLADFAEGDIVFSTMTAKGWTRIQDDRYYFTMTKF